MVMCCCIYSCFYQNKIETREPSCEVVEGCKMIRLFPQTVNVNKLFSLVTCKPVCPCTRADPEEPPEAAGGGAAVAAAAERAAPRRVGPALRLRLLPPARLRGPHRLGTQHPQEARSPGRRAARDGGRGRPPHQLSDSFLALGLHKTKIF